MKSPFTYYKEVAKEFGVTDELNVSPVAKLTFVQEQVVQQRQIINRLLVDISTTLVEQENAKDLATKDAYRKKIDDYRNDLRQLVIGVKNGLQLIDELRAEYKELQIEE